MATGYIDLDLEEMDHMEPEELDRVREVLVYILMKDSDMEPEDVYSMVFRKGKKITWH